VKQKENVHWCYWTRISDKMWYTCSACIWCSIAPILRIWILTFLHLCSENEVISCHVYTCSSLWRSAVLNCRTPLPVERGSIIWAFSKAWNRPVKDTLKKLWSWFTFNFRDSFNSMIIIFHWIGNKLNNWPTKMLFVTKEKSSNRISEDIYSVNQSALQWHNIMSYAIW
jgi:hypothetical protein